MHGYNMKQIFTGCQMEIYCKKISASFLEKEINVIVMNSRTIRNVKTKVICDLYKWRVGV